MGAAGGFRPAPGGGGSPTLIGSDADNALKSWGVGQSEMIVDSDSQPSFTSGKMLSVRIHVKTGPFSPPFFGPLLVSVNGFLYDEVADEEYHSDFNINVAQFTNPNPGVGGDHYIPLSWEGVWFPGRGGGSDPPADTPLHLRAILSRDAVWTPTAKVGGLRWVFTEADIHPLYI